MSSEQAIVIKDLHKNFGDLQAVRGVSFSVRAGEIFSLLGPNGAGKSTTISILCGLLQPAAGDAYILGHSVRSDAEKARAAIGVVPQEIALYPDLSARENLVFWGKMYGLGGAPLRQRVEDVLELIGLSDRQHGRVSTFSGGMKRRVNIGVALLHRPQVIIMDEPTVGIDPQSRRHILDNVKMLNRQGMTVLYTTHYMEEAQELSDHIAIMDHGQLIACGSHEELIRMVGEQTRVDLALHDGVVQVCEHWRQIEGVQQVTALEEEGKVSVLTPDSDRILPKLFETAAQAGARITSVEVFEPNLETVFLHLTGRMLRD